MTPAEERQAKFVLASKYWEAGDVKRAFRHFRSLANLGDAGGLLSIGYFYDVGIAVAQDKKEALRWYRRAYARGDAGGAAANNIGTIFRDRGDTKRAEQWFRRAIDKGSDGSALEIAKLYIARGEPFSQVRKELNAVVASENVSEADQEKAIRLLENPIVEFTRDHQSWSLRPWLTRERLSGQQALIARCERTLRDTRLRRDEPMRVACAKVLAASMPRSLPSIRRLLLQTNGRFAYEVHFSLFVFMADVEEFGGRTPLVKTVVGMLSNYLYDVRVETAQAAWMAAHALGGHIRHPSAGACLVELVRGARHARGRAAAATGLGERLRDSSTSRMKRDYARVLAAAQADRSEDVRISARLAAGELTRRTRRGSMKR